MGQYGAAVGHGADSRQWPGNRQCFIRRHSTSQAAGSDSDALPAVERTKGADQE
jgi:hypothetical protein